MSVANPTFGLTNRFEVVIDGFDLGRWSKCDGLSVTFKNYDYAPLGSNGHKPILPERLVYDNITLTRAISTEDLGRVMQWLARMARGSPTGSAVIKLRDSHDKEVTRWELRSVYPTQWKGPSLNAGGHEIATETLQLAHEGFLKD